MSFIGKVWTKTFTTFRHVTDNKLPRYFNGSRLMSNVYYSFFHNAFKRELTSVLAGKAKYLHDTAKEDGNYFLLIRNIHRLEKGLLMRPRKTFFGADYIGETVDCFRRITEKGDYASNSQFKWAFDVLSEYFSEVTEGNQVIDFQRKNFQAINAFDDSIYNGQEKFIPYKRIKPDQLCTYDEFYKLTRHRRSVRWFTEKPVPRELIDKAIHAAIQAPSACNRQPFEFRIFDDKEMVQQVVNIPMGTRGYGHNIPVVIVVTGNLDAYFSERDRHVIYIDASLASMSLMLALETLGLSSCPINWPDIEQRERQMEKLLALKKYQRPVMCIGVGYADPEGMVAFSAKRPIEMVRSYNNNVSQ